MARLTLTEGRSRQHLHRTDTVHRTAPCGQKGETGGITITQTSAAQQRSENAAHADAPGEGTRASPTPGFNRRRFCGAAAAAVAASPLGLLGVDRRFNVMAATLAGIAPQAGSDK